MIARLMLVLTLFCVIAFETRADLVYVSGDVPNTNPLQGELRLVDRSTGHGQFVGYTPVPMDDLAFAAGVLYGVGEGQLYQIDFSSGSAHSIAIGSGAGVNGLDAAADGTLYGTGGASLYTINTATGSNSLVGDLFTVAADGSTTYYFSSGDLAFVGGGHAFMTAAAYGPSADPQFATGFTHDHLIEFSIVGGAVTDVRDVGDIGFSNVYGLLPSHDGNQTLDGFTYAGQMISIDRSTAAGSLVTDLSPLIYARGAAIVPEPSSILMSGIGLVLASAFLRRRS